MVTRTFYRTREDGVNLYKTESDCGLIIRKVGTEEIYHYAIDIEDAQYEYEETDTAIPAPPPMSEQALAWLEAKKKSLNPEAE